MKSKAFSSVVILGTLAVVYVGCVVQNRPADSTPAATATPAATTAPAAATTPAATTTTTATTTAPPANTGKVLSAPKPTATDAGAAPTQ
ncbi:MAG: hypothetical protein HYZ29_18200 [Myxococcales bacterium]|nr:hypothetical protein [Myxococcales bacterium]